MVTDVVTDRSARVAERGRSEEKPAGEGGGAEEAKKKGVVAPDQGASV